MAHEIAHVAARHGTRQATRGQVINLATIPLIFMGGWVGYGIRQAAGLGISLKFLQFSRAFERQADELGLQYMLKTGYDPQSFISFFEKLQADEKRKPGTFAKVFRTHPLTTKRIKRVQGLLEYEGVFVPRTEYVVDTSEFAFVTERLRKLNAEYRAKDKEYEKGRPTLRRPGGDKIPTDEKEEADEDEDKPPVLKRR